MIKKTNQLNRKIKIMTNQEFENQLRTILGGRIKFINGGKNIKIKAVLAASDSDFSITGGENTDSQFVFQRMRVGFIRTSSDNKCYLVISECYTELTNRDGSGSKKITKPVQGDWIEITNDQYEIAREHYKTSINA